MNIDLKIKVIGKYALSTLLFINLFCSSGASNVYSASLEKGYLYTAEGIDAKTSQTYSGNMISQWHPVYGDFKNHVNKQGILLNTEGTYSPSSFLMYFKGDSKSPIKFKNFRTYFSFTLLKQIPNSENKIDPTYTLWFQYAYQFDPVQCVMQKYFPLEGQAEDLKTMADFLNVNNGTRGASGIFGPGINKNISLLFKVFNGNSGYKPIVGSSVDIDSSFSGGKTEQGYQIFLTDQPTAWNPQHKTASVFLEREGKTLKWAIVPGEQKNLARSFLEQGFNSTALTSQHIVPTFLVEKGQEDKTLEFKTREHLTQQLSLIRATKEQQGILNKQYSTYTQMIQEEEGFVTLYGENVSILLHQFVIRSMAS